MASADPLHPSPDLTAVRQACPAPAVPRHPVGLRAAVSVVIVNFCQWRNTFRLVSQLRRSHAFRSGAVEIVVVDNASPRHRAADKLRSRRGVTVHLSGANVGFATAVNLGKRLTSGDWLLLLNPDVTVADGFLDDVLVAIEKTTRTDLQAGVIGFRLCNPDGSRQASAGPFPSFTSTLGGLLLPRSRRKCRHLSSDDRQPVAWVTGGCLAVHRDCFDALGGLDERFFLYYEDVDFCRRARTAGWSVWYDPSTAVTHHWPLHRRRVPPPLRLVTRHALLTYAARNWASWQTGVLRQLVRVESCLRRFAADRRGDDVATECYRRLTELARNPNSPRTAEHIRYAADQLRPVAAAQDDRVQIEKAGHTVAQ